MEDSSRTKSHRDEPEEALRKYLLLMVLVPLVLSLVLVAAAVFSTPSPGVAYAIADGTAGWPMFSGADLWMTGSDAGAPIHHENGGAAATTGSDPTGLPAGDGSFADDTANFESSYAGDIGCENLTLSATPALGGCDSVIVGGLEYILGGPVNGSALDEV